MAVCDDGLFTDRAPDCYSMHAHAEERTSVLACRTKVTASGRMSVSAQQGHASRGLAAGSSRYSSSWSSPPPPPYPTSRTPVLPQASPFMHSRRLSAVSAQPPREPRCSCATVAAVDLTDHAPADGLPALQQLQRAADLHPAWGRFAPSLGHDVGRASQFWSTISMPCR
jgi:hypothetical protein